MIGPKVTQLASHWLGGHSVGFSAIHHCQRGLRDTRIFVFSCLTARRVDVGKAGGNLAPADLPVLQDTRRLLRS